MSFHIKIFFGILLNFKFDENQMCISEHYSSFFNMRYNNLKFIFVLWVCRKTRKLTAFPVKWYLRDHAALAPCIALIAANFQRWYSRTKTTEGFRDNSVMDSSRCASGYYPFLLRVIDAPEWHAFISISTIHTESAA